MNGKVGFGDSSNEAPAILIQQAERAGRDSEKTYYERMYDKRWRNA